MAVVPEISSGGSHTADHVNQPFHLRSAVYDSTNDELDITVGEGRVDWGDNNVTEFTTAQVVNVASPTTGTTYYVYVQSDDTLYTSTSATYDGAATQAVRLGSVATGATVSDLTLDDLRGILPTSPQLADVQVFTASGTWNKPEHARLVLVEAWGGGGGGGAGESTGSGVAGDGGNGGGGGGYNHEYFHADDLSASVSVTVGAGGSGGAPGGNAAEGGASTFGSLLRAGAGERGSRSAAARCAGGGSYGDAFDPVAQGGDPNPLSTLDKLGGAGGDGGGSAGDDGGRAEYGGGAGGRGLSGSAAPGKGGGSMHAGGGGGGGGGQSSGGAAGVGEEGGAHGEYIVGGGGAQQSGTGEAGNPGPTRGDGGGGGAGGEPGGTGDGDGGDGGAGAVPGGGGGGGGASESDGAHTGGTGGTGARGEVRVTTWR